MPWQWQNSYNGALGGTRTRRTWFLRPVRMPFRHQGIWWLWLVSIQPPRLMRAVRIHLRHTTDVLGCLMGIEPTHIGITTRGLTTWRQTPYLFANTLSFQGPACITSSTRCNCILTVSRHTARPEHVSQTHWQHVVYLTLAHIHHRIDLFCISKR